MTEHVIPEQRQDTVNNHNNTCRNFKCRCFSSILSPVRFGSRIRVQETRSSMELQKLRIRCSGSIRAPEPSCGSSSRALILGSLSWRCGRSFSNCSLLYRHSIKLPFHLIQGFNGSGSFNSSRASSMGLNTWFLCDTET